MELAVACDEALLIGQAEASLVRTGERKETSSLAAGPLGSCGNNPNRSPLRIAHCGFTRLTQNIKKDFAVCSDFQSCNSDSQKDSDKTLAPYYRQKHSRKYILMSPMLLIARKRSVIDFLLEPTFLHFNNNIKGVIHGKKNRENCSTKCFWTKERQTRIKI